MNTAPDVVVVGLGAHGAAITHELARRGAAVLGVDMHTPPHAYGSTTGRTRVIREAYFEHPLYVPLVQRAAELWSELEELTGTVLLRTTGGLMAGPPDGELVRGALASVHAHGLPHEFLDETDLRRRFPALDPPAGTVAVLEPRAGVLLADACVRALLDIARGYGAQLRTNTRVTSWYDDGADIVLAGSGFELRARQVVFAAGPWLPGLLRAGAQETARAFAPPPLQVERQTSHWFVPAPGVTRFAAAVCPVTILEYVDGRLLYTLPDVGHGVKVGIHHGGATVDPDTVERTIGMAEESCVRELLERWMPGAAHRVADSAVCLYTNTPDHHFIVDHHPHARNVTLVSACSGHGFKFAPALAEIVADLVLEGETRADLGAFALARFGI